MTDALLNPMDGRRLRRRRHRPHDGHTLAGHSGGDGPCDGLGSRPVTPNVVLGAAPITTPRTPSSLPTVRLPTFSIAACVRSTGSRTRSACDSGDRRAWANDIREGFSDLRFADANRVPFPFAPHDARQVQSDDRRHRIRRSTPARSRRWLESRREWIVWAQRRRVRSLQDVDSERGGTASRTSVRSWARCIQSSRTTSACCGRISGLDEVSFHMSGTEAVMAAVRLARFNTRRKLIVCFSGAYHGWWDGVIPGLGSERPLDDCLTLKDLSPASLAGDRAACARDRGRARQSGAVLPSQHAAAERRRAADERGPQRRKTRASATDRGSSSSA